MSKRTNLMRLCFVLAAFLVVIVGLFMNQGLTAYIIALILFIIAAVISKPRSSKKTK